MPNSRVLGVSVSPKARTSNAHLVLVERLAAPTSTIQTVTTYVAKSQDEDLAIQISRIAKSVRGQVQSLRPELVVIRRADQGPIARNGEGPRLRLLIEGGIIAACADLNTKVILRSGNECVRASTMSKEELVALAKQLESVSTPYLEAATAALAWALHPDAPNA